MNLRTKHNNWYIGIFLFEKWNKYKHHFPVLSECWEIGPVLIIRNYR